MALKYYVLRRFFVVALPMAGQHTLNKILAVLLFCGLASGLHADAIDDYINAELLHQKVPGLALAVMRNGHLIRAQGYGFANLEHHVPVHPDTVFKSGALGKQFTAAAVMLLVEDGKLKLDESIRTYLPEAPETWAPITIRQLLNHTSGLAPFPAGDFRADYTEEELLGNIYPLPIMFTAGSRWGYSYSGYVVLGCVISRITGEHYSNLLAKRVFAPLEMQTARLINEIAIVPNRANGYVLNDGELQNPEWVSPTANSTADGALYLSVLDYARWEAGMTEGKILKAQSWAEVARPAKLANGRTYPYGFGWYLEHEAGQDIWYHSGEWQGFKTAAIRYLGDGLTLVALANGDAANPEKILRHVAGMLDPKLVRPAAFPMKDREPKMTKQVKKLLQQLAKGTAEFDAFAYVPEPDFIYVVGPYEPLLAPMGALRELALFARTERGNDKVYRYRARYEGGLVDISLSYAPNGKISEIKLVPIEDWNTPL